MAQQFSAGAGAILAGADASATARESVSGSINSVRSSVDGIGAGWEGAAGRSMRTTVDRWIEASTKVNDVLLKFEQDLRQTDTDYVATEDDQSSSFSNIAGRMG
jgi:WXG100 family type VII secretion target